MIRSNTQKLVIIGNGMAGARVAEEILKRAPLEWQITIIGTEKYGNYNRILLSNVLNGTQKPEEIFLNPITWYQQNHILLLAGVTVLNIKRDEHLVQLSDAREIPYDKVIIATGSRPFVPPIPGIDLSGVFVFRTLDDCNAITHYAVRSKTAVVIGGGLLGLEAAKGLMNHGVEVHIVEMSTHLMSIQLDAVGGAILGQTVEKLGVKIHCGKATVELVSDSARRVCGVKFKDGTELPCDMVVFSAGIRPNIDIAKNCCLPVNRAILVNDQMLTADPDIYAVGECCEHTGKTYGLVAPIWEQCAVLADHLTGKNLDAAYHGSYLATKLKVMGVNVASFGPRDAEPSDEVVRYEEAESGIYKKLILRAGKLIGASLLGDVDSYSDLLTMMQSGAALPTKRSELLFGVSTKTEYSLADLPDSKQICDCNGVCKGTIATAIKDGKTTVAAVGKATRAGTGCGSCKKLIKGLIESIAGEIKADPSESWYVPAIPLDKPALIAAIKAQKLKSVSATLQALGTKADEKSKMGLAILLKALWNKEYIDERDARFINDRVHANIQNDGTYSVIPRIYGGVTSADELIKIGAVAKKWNVRMVKLTGGQRIDLLGVKKADLPEIWKDLGMPSGYAYTKAFRTCKTCVGSEFCRFGTNDSTALGIAIEKRFQGLETPAKVKMAVSGCPRNCSESTVKDIGVIASDGGEWEIVVGGAAGASVRKADILTRVKTQEEALKFISRFMQYYRNNANYLERTYDFVPRIGIEKLRAILVEDSEGIGTVLDAEIQASIEAYVDPWLEGQNPVHPGQFSEPGILSLPILAS